MNQDIIIPAEPGRADFMRVQQALESMGLGSNFIVNQADLRLEEVLTADKNQYEFSLYENSASDRKLERKLNRNDLFFLTHIAVCLTKQDAGAEDYGNYQLFTHPDPNFFVGVSGGNKEYQSLLNVYNGQLSISTEPVERLSGFLTNNFLYIPEKPYLNASSPQVEELGMYGPTDEARGYFRLNPNLILDGNDQNKISLRLGKGNKAVIAGGVDASGDAVDTSNVLVILAKGFVAKNAAQKMGRWTGQKAY
ncbi:MAG: hypothetical protein KDC34_19065 [Saprospiraceae bacterium]|nr:hypothetical protein [Saprospiraceae bacterium]